MPDCFSSGANFCACSPRSFTVGLLGYLHLIIGIIMLLFVFFLVFSLIISPHNRKDAPCCCAPGDGIRENQHLCGRFDGLLLLLCAVAHRLQLGTASYEGSMLAVVELLLFFLMLFSSSFSSFSGFISWFAGVFARCW
jgi:hypothetical protein